STETETLITLDNAGTVLWSKNYDVPFAGIYGTSRIKFFPNGDFLMFISTYSYAGYIIINPTGTILRGEGLSADSALLKDPGFDAEIFNDSLFAISSKAEGDNYILTLSRTGNLKWANRYIASDPNAYHQPRAIKKTADGNLLVCGLFQDSLTAGPFLMKIDLNGNILWRKTYNSALFGGLTFDAITERANGDIVMKDMYNIVLLITNSNGQTLIGKIIDGNNCTIGLSSPKMVTSCNRIEPVSGNYVPGLYKNNDDLDNKCLFIDYFGFVGTAPVFNPTITHPVYRFPIPNSSIDANVTTIATAYNYTLADACVGVGVEENNLSGNFNLFPNPANENVSVSLNSVSGTENLTLQIFDITGKLISSEKISSANGTLNFSTQRLENGIYLLQVKEGKNIYGIKKLIVSH
ncbi:MAG: T9SS type A sorting domain-containing protein, partial [Bacteroidia bacterium]|nr:T9SS type A sorting domain-containing protein [Bacteroidia bacterium]